MKYVLMCGGRYSSWEYPKQLVRISGEPLVVRTTRLLVENGVDKKNIMVTAHRDYATEFMKYCDTVCVNNANEYDVKCYDNFTGFWCDCFYSMDEPCTYLCGDVVFSPGAIKKIIDTDTDDIEFFASAPPFVDNYLKKWAEPFAFKVVNQEHLRSAQVKTKWLYKKGAFKRKPIAWEFWQVVKGTPLNEIDYTNYIAINDYTCDIDEPEDIKFFEGV